MEPLPRPQLSVVVPVYNEAGNVAPLFTEIRDVLTSLGRPFEVIYVNDGSHDATLSQLRALQEGYPELCVVDLDGNFGEAAALCAGFATARAALVITLDGDGQNDPHDIPRLLATLEHGGYRVVSGWRKTRQEDVWSRVIPSRLANTMIRWVTGIPAHDNGCGLKIYRREIVHGAALPRGLNRFLPAILGVTAAEVAEVAVHDRNRQHGVSHYGLSRTGAVLRDVLAIPFLVRQPETNQRRFALTAVLALLWMLVGRSGCLPALIFLLSASIWWNLRRFNRGRRDGVYRIGAVYPSNLGSA